MSNNFTGNGDSEKSNLTTGNTGRKLKRALSAFINNPVLSIIFLLTVKIIFQFIILDSGYRWLSADDYCRTVKSFEWMQDPAIYSGVWLTPHFWLNGIVMLFIDDLFVAATLVNFIFSALTLIYFYKSVKICFDKRNAFFSSLIFSFFPFQVWLSISGLPESVFFFFIVAGIFYFIKWKFFGRHNFHLVFSAICFALSNGFRYEGWLFSAVFVLFVIADSIVSRKFNKQAVINFCISLISFLTIFWWLIQNYIDHNDSMFFAKETTKIFDEFNSAGFFQRLVQYPTFIFFIAPLTTFFSLKAIYDAITAQKLTPVKIFLLFNIAELLMLILQGMLGTGGTNMISRYIVINALLLVPFAVQQAFEFRKSIAVVILMLVAGINIIWSFYYPQPFREDTFEVGKILNNIKERNHISEKGKIYFEEVQGYFDVFAVQSLSNDPSRFVLGNIPTIVTEENIKKGKKKKIDEEELNILEMKSYLEKNNIKLAVVKSEGYSEKLKKLSFRDEEVGEYKLFYFENREMNLNDSTISIFSENILKLQENPDLINFEKLLALQSFDIDNTNFGLNPQTVTLTWSAVNDNIIDSIEYEKYEFDRYIAAIDLNSAETDSLVFSAYAKIFSDRNIEDLIDNNTIRNIIVLKPFALLNYSKQYGSSPFEGGVYKINLRVIDKKLNRDLRLYRGEEYLKPDTTETLRDALSVKGDTAFKNIFERTSLADSQKIRTVRSTRVNKDSLLTQYNLGFIIAMFPDSDYNKIVKRSTSEIYNIIMRNGMQLFFSQRYRGDQFLNWVFNYF